LRTPVDSHLSDRLPEAKDPRYPSEPPGPAVLGGDLPLARIAVKSVNRIAIVQVASIVRLEAEDNYVRLWADRPYLHKETLTGLVARLDPNEFLRIHRSHAVNVRCVRELRPLLHGEYLVLLSDGTELTSGRSYRAAIQAMFGLA
jgi:two-component system LytT family response regulator